VACAEQHKMCSVGAGRVFGLSDDSGCHVKAASILHTQTGNYFSTERKMRERVCKECDLFKSKLSCLLQCVDREQRRQVHVGESAHHDGSQVCTQMAAGTGNVKQALTENLAFQISILFF